VKLQYLPNAISIVRILLVYPVIALLLERRFDWALGLFTMAGLSDGLDGFLAKHYGWQSRLGSYLDPLADKLLLVSCFITAGWLGLIPGWLVVAAVLRDVVIVTGGVLYYFLLHPFSGNPLLLSKLNTLCQLILIVAVLLNESYLPLPKGLITSLIYIVFTTILTSGILYVYIWGRSYWRETHPDW
jgi:cardiolipin synthase